MAMDPAMDLAEPVPEGRVQRPPAKRALLIGSSYGGLPGTEHDVDNMARILERYGFDAQDNVTKLCGSDATRQNILDEWGKLASPSTQVGDVVVIYYSGHGGLAELPTEENASRQHSEQQPNRIQFLVPHNFDPTMEHWRGIMDAELSLLLLKTTARTPNVTYILDCCHSARLGRAPDKTRTPRAKVLKFDYNILLKHMDRLRDDKSLLENEFWSNPDVVRIAAAGDREAAWQYQNVDGQDVGIMTEKLDHIMKHPGNQMSWRSIMLGVKALVELEFSNDRDAQQPRSAGADIRIPFSLANRVSRALLAVIGNEYTTIEGGRVHAVHEGDDYTLIPFNSREEIETATATVTNVDRERQDHTEVEFDQREQIKTTNARVESVNGFAAVIFQTTKRNFSTALALALPFQRHRPWPVKFPAHLQHIQELLGSSNFFKRCESGEEPLVEFRQHDEWIVLYGRGVQLGPRKVYDCSNTEKLFSVAHMFAQAQDILSVEGGKDDEHFRPNIEIEIGVVDGYKEELRGCYRTESAAPHEPAHLAVGDKYYVRIKYDCKSEADKVYVSVLRIDTTGKTTLVTRAWERGLDLSYAVKSRLLATNSLPLAGIPIDWPESVPRQKHVEENFVFVMTREPIDLQALEASSSVDFLISRGTEPPSVASRRTTNPYDVMRVPYLLHWPEYESEHGTTEAEEEGELDLQAVVAPNLPTPETVEEWRSLSRYLGGTSVEAKSGIGHFTRFVTRVPPYVWVINQHNEDITVVVKKFSPNRQLSSVKVSASPAGGGVNFGSTRFTLDGTEKKLAPQARDPDKSIASFPLWTREDGFGIISIFTGPEKKPYILNDRVRMGARVYFRGGPDLVYED